MNKTPKMWEATNKKTKVVYLITDELKTAYERDYMTKGKYTFKPAPADAIVMDDPNTTISSVPAVVIHEKTRTTTAKAAKEIPEPIEAKKVSINPETGEQ
jgi:hypothetical protein